MIPSNQLMQKSDWKKRCEAALLTIATLTVKWSGEKAERKRLTHTMFKLRHKLEQAYDLLNSPLDATSEARAIRQLELRAEALLSLMNEALELTQLQTAGIGKKEAKREGLVIE